MRPNSPVNEPDLSKFGTQIAAKDIAVGTLRGATEGGVMALVALPIDQGLNVLYRQTGMSATAANALSGATSTAVVGVGGIGATVWQWVSWHLVLR